MLAGCGGSQPPIGVPFSASSTRLTAQRPATRGTFKVLYSFSGLADGGGPSGLLNVGGTLYGATYSGGLKLCERKHYYCGTVFSIATSGTQTQLYAFRGTARKDGAFPNAPLTDVSGTLYGTTVGGGRVARGTVYSITPSGAEKVLHSFTGPPGDGIGPAAGLVNVKGTLYGTTTAGGANGDGTLYSITPFGTETVLYSFAGGGSPTNGALLNVNGTLYGTAGGGCCGIVYAIAPSGKVNVLYAFGGSPDGRGPAGGLISVNGKLYGVTEHGGTGKCKDGCGTIFAITMSGKETVVYSFQSSKGKSAASYPYGTLTVANGILYGAAQDNFYYDYTTTRVIYAVTPSGSEKVVHQFDDSSGGESPVGLLTNINGTLYGATSQGGGGCSCGTVFALHP
jgi:uncharacterized repeat protein (TIGR03803 family)